MKIALKVSLFNLKLTHKFAASWSQKIKSAVYHGVDLPMIPREVPENSFNFVSGGIVGEEYAV